jgi:hypothetical protein
VDEVHSSTISPSLELGWTFVAAARALHKPLAANCKQYQVLPIGKSTYETAATIQDSSFAAQYLVYSLQLPSSTTRAKHPVPLAAKPTSNIQPHTNWFWSTSTRTSSGCSANSLQNSAKITTVERGGTSPAETSKRVFQFSHVTLHKGRRATVRNNTVEVEAFSHHEHQHWHAML